MMASRMRPVQSHRHADCELFGTSCSNRDFMAEYRQVPKKGADFHSSFNKLQSVLFQTLS